MYTSQQFKQGIKVTVMDHYLNDEASPEGATAKATVFSEPGDDEELVGIQYEDNSLDYVPRDVLEIVNLDTMKTQLEGIGFSHLSKQNKYIKGFDRINIIYDLEKGYAFIELPGKPPFGIPHIQSLESVACLVRAIQIG